AAILPDAPGTSVVAAGDPRILEPEAERAAARSALRHGRPIGFPPGANPGLRGVHFPLIAGTTVNAVLSLRGTEPGALLDPERMEMVRAYSSLTALALERCRLAEESRRAQTQIEAERTRSALLSSV